MNDQAKAPLIFTSSLSAQTDVFPLFNCSAMISWPVIIKGGEQCWDSCFFHFMKTSTCLCLRFEVTSLRIAISDNKLQWSIRWRGKLSGFGTDIMKRWNIIHCRNSQHCLFPIPVKNSFWFWYTSLQVQIKKSYLPWVPQLIWLIKSCPTSNTSSVHLDSRFSSAVKVFYKWIMWKKTRQQ